ncbi:ATP-binding protein [Candidatus Woesearchaeota archaeon]|nr:ATP-binding protein [Candidatus Woesearchaeota archaeon]
MALLSFAQQDISLEDFTDPSRRPPFLQDALQHDTHLDYLISQLDTGGISLRIDTDSSDYERFQPLFTQHIQPLVEASGYAVDDARLLLGEVYVNAVLHGNEAGEILEYRRRGLPIPEHHDENLQKHITVEYLLSPAFYLLRVTDEGEGFDITSIQHDLTPEHHLSKSGGTGQVMIFRLSDSFYYTPPGNRITMVVYHPTVKQERICSASAAQS